MILYCGNNNWFAAYANWYFKLYGHDKVRLLAGGRKKWELDGRPLTTATVKLLITEYNAKAPDKHNPYFPRRGPRRDRQQEPTQPVVIPTE